MKKFYLLLFFFLPTISKSIMPEVPEFDWVKIINYDTYSERRTVWEVALYDLKNYILLVPNISINLPTQKNPFNQASFTSPTILSKDGNLLKKIETRKTGTYFDNLSDTLHVVSYVIPYDDKIRIICKRGYQGIFSFSYNSHPLILDYNYNLELIKLKTDTTLFHPLSGTYLAIENQRYFYGWSNFRYLKDSLGYIQKRWVVYFIREYVENENYFNAINDIELKFPENIEDTLNYGFRVKDYPDKGFISGYFNFKDSTGLLFNRLCFFDAEGNFLSYNKQKLPPVFINSSIFDKDDNAYTFNRNLSNEELLPTFIKYDKYGNKLWEVELPGDFNPDDNIKVYINSGNINAKFLDSNLIAVYNAKYTYNENKIKVLHPFIYLYDTDGNLLKAYEWDLQINDYKRWHYIQTLIKEDDEHLIILGRTSSNMALNGEIALGRIKFSLTNIKEEIKNKKSKFDIFPNPAKQEIYTNLSDGNYSYNITDVTGKIIQNGRTQGKIDIINLQTGIYVLEIIDKNKKYYAKFIKE